MDTKKIESDSKERSRREALVYAQKKAKRKFEKLKKEHERNERIKAIEEKYDIIKWLNEDNKGLLYEGFLNKNLLFTIKKGLSLYTLTVIAKNIIKEKSDQGLKCSPDFRQLKDKARKIMLKYIKQ